MNPKTDRELDAALLAAAAESDSDDALQVYGDLLCERNDPRGQLSILDRQILEQSTGEVGRELRSKRAALLADAGDKLIGPLFGNEWLMVRRRFHLGFASELQLSGQGPTGELTSSIAEVLDHPSAELVRTLSLGPFIDDNDEPLALAELVTVLANTDLPALRTLRVGRPAAGNWPLGCAIGPLFERFDRLCQLSVAADSALELGGLPDSLISLDLHMSGLGRDHLAAAVAGRGLTRLDLFLHQTELAATELCLLLRELPATIEHLGLRACAFADDVVAALDDLPPSITLAFSVLTDEGAAHLCDRPGSISRLDVSDCALSEESIEALRAAVIDLEPGVQNPNHRAEDPERRIRRRLRANEAEAAHSALACAEAFGFSRQEKRAIAKLVQIHSDVGDIASAVMWQEMLVKRSPGDRALITNLAHNYCLAGRAHEAEELVEEALISAEPGPACDRLRLELVVTRLYLGVAEVKLCEELADSPHLRDAPRVWDVLGNVYRRGGQLEKALKAFEEALAREPDADSHSTHKTNIAQLRALLGDIAGADAGLLDAIKKTRQSGDRRRLAAALANLGQTMVNSGRAIAGRPYLEEAVELYRAMGIATGVGSSLLNLGQSFAGVGDNERARTCYEEAETALREAGSLPHVATAVCYQAQIAKEQGELEEARALGLSAKEIAERADCCWSMGTANVLLGDICLQECNLDRARDAYETAGRASKRIQNNRWFAWTRERLGRVAYADGLWDEAKESYDEAFEILEAIGDDQMLGMLKTSMAVLASVSGNGDSASLLGAAYEHLERCGVVSAQAKHALAAAFIDRGGRCDGDDSYSQWLRAGVEANELKE